MKQDLTKITNDRCLPVAREVLKMIGNYEDNIFGVYDQKEANKKYKQLVQDIKSLMLEKNLLLSDINYILKAILQPIDAVKYIINENFNKLLEDSQNKFWGKPKDEVTIKDLDEQLQK